VLLARVRDLEAIARFHARGTAPGTGSAGPDSVRGALRRRLQPGVLPVRLLLRRGGVVVGPSPGGVGASGRTAAVVAGGEHPRSDRGRTRAYRPGSARCRGAPRVGDGHPGWSGTPGARHRPRTRTHGVGHGGAD